MKQCTVYMWPHTTDIVFCGCGSVSLSCPQLSGIRLEKVTISVTFWNWQSDIHTHFHALIGQVCWGEKGARVLTSFSTTKCIPGDWKMCTTIFAVNYIMSPPPLYVDWLFILPSSKAILNSIYIFDFQQGRTTENTSHFFLNTSWPFGVDVRGK